MYTNIDEVSIFISHFLSTMLLASQFEVCFSLTFCLFDVFMTERALDTVSVSPFLDAILFLM